MNGLSLLPVVKRIAESPLGLYVRHSVRAVPVVANFHLLAFVVLTGVVLVVNLSVLGIAIKEPAAAALERALWPYFLGSLAIAVVTGVTILTSNAISYYYNPVFRTKMAMLLLATVLYAVLHRHLRRSAGSVITRPWKILAGLNLSLWFGTLIAGRVVGLF